jgi:type III pantothenate kinase
MKSLAIDIGNTKIKYGVFDANLLLQSKSFDSNKFKEEIEIVLEKYRPEYSILADVTNKYTLISDLLQLKSKLFIWNESTQYPIKNLYKSNTLGIDRFCISIAANNLYRYQNVLAVSIGTCITYEFVNNKNEYEGGAISLGLKMRAEALHHYTAKLPKVSLQKEFNLIGSTTESSILSGIMNGTINEINGAIENYKLLFPDIKVILTGGGADILQPHIKNEIFAHRDLVLHGLNLILLYNNR